MSMPQFRHSEFIETPLINLLRDVVSDSNNVNDGIEFYGICGYVLHSLFLRMTGAQEQKLKCICWDLATEDYEYRYSRFNKWELGECSRLKDKSIVFSDLVAAVRALKPNYSVFGNAPANKQTFIDKTFVSIKSILDNSNIVTCYPGEYDTYLDIVNQFDINNIEAGDQLFRCPDNLTLENMTDDTVVAATYTLLYKHRNRCAHNTLSYQNNIPTFQELNNEIVQRYYNIFLFITILIVIDNLFMQVYKKYRNVLSRF